jgi:hypothetical protein
MGRRNRISITLMLIAAFSLVGIPAANAYVDPGTGSFIFQAIVGGMLAAALALKVFWRRIVSMVSGRRQTAHREAPSEHSTSGVDD